MTRLIVYSAADSSKVQLDTHELTTIQRELSALGAGLERWSASPAQARFDARRDPHRIWPRN
jgi:hypothetical protein